MCASQSLHDISNVDSIWGKARMMYVSCCPSWVASVPGTAANDAEDMTCPLLSAVSSLLMHKDSNICPCWLIIYKLSLGGNAMSDFRLLEIEIWRLLLQIGFANYVGYGPLGFSERVKILP